MPPIFWSLCTSTFSPKHFTAKDLNLMSKMLSRQARFLEKSFKAIGMRNIITKTMLNPKRRSRNEEPPKSYYKKYRYETRVIHGCKCVTLSKTENSKKHVLYFHGRRVYNAGAKIPLAHRGCFASKNGLLCYIHQLPALTGAYMQRYDEHGDRVLFVLLRHGRD